ncbi:MAG TPA: hypothetical protein ENK26_11405 [Gammaproteobacteria bacterium]|nr:hypothetical protein [Gammaproteobacteria bacterium]
MENKTVRKTLKRTLLAIMTVSAVGAQNVALADGFAAAKRMPTQRLKSGEPHDEQETGLLRQHQEATKIQSSP